MRTQRWYKVTGWFIFATVVVWIGYDIFVASFAGVGATESVFILDTAHRYPVLVFALGVLFGHFFASQQREAVWQKAFDSMQQQLASQNPMGAPPPQRIGVYHGPREAGPPQPTGQG